jgi:hypothetical protein
MATPSCKRLLAYGDATQRLAVTVRAKKKTA